MTAVGAIGANVAVRVLYISYPISDKQAPHQSMAAVWLARAGFDVVLLAWGNEAPSDRWLSEHPRLAYRAVPKRRIFSAFAFLAAAFAAMRRFRPDVVYVQGAQNAPFGLWLRLAHRKARVVYHTQDYLGPGQHRFYEACEAMLARRADEVICNERNRARFMASSYRLRNVPRVLPTALPTWWPVPSRDPRRRADLVSRAGLEAIGGRVRLIAAGGPYAVDRMSRELVDAFATLPEHYALVFTSMGPDQPARRQLEAQLQSSSVSRRVVLLGALEYPDLLASYAACDIGILLYPDTGIGHYYQCPGRLTEYLRCGLPVVTSNFPGFELLVCQHGIGKTADPYDPRSIALALRSLGEVSEQDREATRERLISLGSTDLAYDRPAEGVFREALTGLWT